jgi:hypothetical protein
MNTDDELRAWSAEWRRESQVPPDLRRRIARGTRRMRWGIAAEILVTVVSSLFSLRFLFEGETESRFVFATIWATLIAAWGFSIANRRGTWKAASETTSAFLDLSILRAGRTLQALTFSYVLYIVTAALFFAAAWQRVQRRPVPPDPWTWVTSGGMLVWWTYTAVAFTVMAFEYRRKQRELRALRSFRDQLSQSDDVTGQSAD